MACPHVVDGGGLQIWGVAANILNKQLQTADKGWSSSLKVEWELTIPQCTKNSIFHRTLDLDGYLRMTYTTENGHEILNWNVGSLSWLGSLKTVF
jgi:hypothetical protein